MSKDLEPIEKEQNPLKTFYLPSSSGEVHRYYRKSEADKVVAAKDKEIQRLHRALFKACANWAYATETIAANLLDVDEAKKWAAVYARCIKKAGESK